eukprot:CAMPEP_0176442888 /NCGR_PEP_ID=MMETSP0127-20121128/22085_1 /TAXON_ID=938130 /ORGANISM="Platyophrya macrostoma, Strain WH" /LENGTH=421 /DNA_ID=CAMNT_0017827991 /DNA_START=22 /DNA_END=1287 /DNA_ORIENTATION=-
MEIVSKRTDWQKPAVSDAVKRTKNPIRGWIENSLSKVKPDVTKKPLVFTVGDPVNYAGFEASTRCLETLAASIGDSNGYVEHVGALHCRKYLADLYSTDRWQLTEDDVFLNSGCSGSLLGVNLALADAGDTVLLPKPGFPLMQAICEERGVHIENYRMVPEKNWEIDLEDLEEKLKKKPKFLLVNNPSNPLGAVWSPEHIQEILDLANKYKVPILADEVYEKMVFPGEPINSFGKMSNGQPVFVCSGIAKIGLAPGWRLGWIICYGRKEIIDPIKKALVKLATYTSHPTTTVQAQLPALFTESLEHLKAPMETVKERIQILAHAVRGLPGISVMEAQGAMYAVVRLDFDQLKDIKNSRDFALKLYEEENVNTLPGSLFGSDTFIRLVSLADADYFKEFGVRLRNFMERHLAQENREEQPTI